MWRIVNNPWCKHGRHMTHRVGQFKRKGFRLFAGVWVLYGPHIPLN